MEFRINHESNIQSVLTQIERYLGASISKKIEQAQILTICSELINNIYIHAGKGMLHISTDEGKVLLVAKDHGPGFSDIDKIIKEGYSTKSSLGIGIPAIIRMSDDLEAKSNKNGVEIRITKVLS